MPEEVTLGGNMTSLTFHLSHALAVSDFLLRPGPRNVVVCRDSHDANVSPWVRMALATGSHLR